MVMNSHLNTFIECYALLISSFFNVKLSFLTIDNSDCEIYVMLNLSIIIIYKSFIWLVVHF